MNVLGILNPAGLWALALLPFLLLPYLLRERPKPRVVAALFLYEGVERATRLRLFGAPRLEPIFILQLLALAVAIFAIVRPALEREVPRAALVIDNAATMQAADAEGRSRLDVALAAARARIDAAPASAWDVFVLRPAPRTLATAADAGEAKSALGGVVVSDVARAEDSSVTAFLDGLAAFGYATVAVATDRLEGRRAPPFEVLSVGEPVDNWGIVAFTAEPGAKTSAVRIEARSFAGAAAEREVAIEDVASGKRLGAGKLEIAAGGAATYRAEVSGDARALRARLLPADRFTADDEAFATVAASRRRVLLVASLGLAESGLAAVAEPLSLDIEAMKPDAYRADSALGRDLVIFHRAAPAEPPAVPALYLLPPPAPFLPTPGAVLAAPALAAAAPTHPALRYLNAASLAPRRAVVLQGGADWTPLLVAAAGPVTLTRASEPPVAAVGFDLLPYLGDRNRPASILMLDLVAWLGDARGSRTAPVGEPLRVPGNARAVTLPDGTRLAPAPAWVETPKRGIYWIDFAAEREPRARTFASPSESDLRARSPLPLPPPREGAIPPRLEKQSRPLWPIATVVVAALLLLEAVLRSRLSPLGRGRREAAGEGERPRAPPPHPRPRPRRDLSPTGRGAWALRTLVLILLVAAFADPKRESPGEPRPETVLLDVSDSVLDPARESARARAQRLAPTARSLRFAADLAVDDETPLARSATDLEATLLRVAATSDGPGAVVLASDGWETRGDARRALPALRDRGLRIDALPIAQPPPGNVGLVRLGLPTRGDAGKPVEASLVLRNENAKKVRADVELRRGDTVVGRRSVELPPGTSAITLPALLADEGLLEFSARVRVADRDANRVAADDLAKAWVAVAGRPSILLVGPGESENRFLARALDARGFKVRSVLAGRGREIPSPDGFGAVILNDVAANALAPGTAARLRDYVSGGGSLVMTGGERAFGLGGWRDTPVEEALPVRMKERERDEPRLAVALVIDKSGSMREESRMVYAREAARALAEGLNDQDLLSVIGFDREAFIEIPLLPASEVRQDFESRIARLRPMGGTRLYPGLVAARRELLGEEAKRRHVIILSDGLSEDAETAAGRRLYYDLALALSEQGVTVSAIALGDSADADFLERLAGFGRGAFHLTLDPSTLPDLVLGEFRRSSKAPEKTIRERRVEPVPSIASPLIGEVARASRDWPPLLGLVETTAKPRARIDVAARGDDAPVLASWEYGSGRAVAFTSDAYGRWSDRWVRWGEWSRIWGGIAAWLVPSAPESGAEVTLGFEPGAIVVDVAFDRDPGSEPASARLAGPDGFAAEAKLVRQAPGFYRARLGTDAPGDYRIELRGARGPLVRPALGFTVAAEVAETPREAANLDLLGEIARATGGSVDPEPGRRAPILGPPHEQPFAPWLLAAAMVLFILDLVLRRLAVAR